MGTAKPADKEPFRLSRFFGLKRVLIANVAVFILVGWGFAGEYLRNHEMQQEVDRLKGQAEELEAKNLELARLGERFSTPEMVEREARTKLNLQKPGEEVVVVQGNLASTPVPPPPPEGSVQAGDERLPNPVRWWRYFFHRSP